MALGANIQGYAQFLCAPGNSFDMDPAAVSVCGSFEVQQLVYGVFDGQKMGWFCDDNIDR